jgi:hypothetical protein
MAETSKLKLPHRAEEHVGQRLTRNALHEHPEHGRIDAAINELRAGRLGAAGGLCVVGECLRFLVHRLAPLIMTSESLPYSSVELHARRHLKDVSDRHAVVA